MADSLAVVLLLLASVGTEFAEGEMPG